MNLHEECLIKYLTNPSDLFRLTEILKAYNLIIEKKFAKNGFIAKNNSINYTGV